MSTINEVCAYLNNWFDKDDECRTLPSLKGVFTISDGIFADERLSDILIDGQYFRIQNSVLNDGVYQYPVSNLADETFTGKITPMRIPSDFLNIVDEIEKWLEKYGGVESVANSPFNSESFAGYSYNKSTDGGTASNMPLWWSSFGGRLSRWRKLR